MSVSAKKPFTQTPRMNVLKDQLKEQRFGLITKVKALRERRQTLKGVKGSGQQWAELCSQIDEVQGKIDLLSKSLGLPVKVQNHSQSGRKHSMTGNLKPTIGRPVHSQGKGDLNHRQDNTSQIAMDDEDHVIWDRLDKSVNGNK